MVANVCHQVKKCYGEPAKSRKWKFQHYIERPDSYSALSHFVPWYIILISFSWLSICLFIVQKYFLTIKHYYWKKSSQNSRTKQVFLQQAQRLLFHGRHQLFGPRSSSLRKERQIKNWQNFILIFKRMKYKIWVFNFNVISVRIHSDFEFIIFVKS